MLSAHPIDVLVAGGGNAGLCAAMVASEAGARVLVLECAPRDFRGGNSRHTRNLRYMHEAPDEILTGAYPEEEFWQDLSRVTKGKTNEPLARLAIRFSAGVGRWMTDRGVRLQPPLEVPEALSEFNQPPWSTRTTAPRSTSASRWSTRRKSPGSR